MKDETFASGGVKNLTPASEREPGRWYLHASRFALAAALTILAWAMTTLFLLSATPD
jgi:hypothetical protein